MRWPPPPGNGSGMIRCRAEAALYRTRQRPQSDTHIHTHNRKMCENLPPKAVGGWGGHSRRGEFIFTHTSMTLLSSLSLPTNPLLAERHISTKNANKLREKLYFILPFFLENPFSHQECPVPSRSNPKAGYYIGLVTTGCKCARECHKQCVCHVN